MSIRVIRCPFDLTMIFFSSNLKIISSVANKIHVKYHCSCSKVCGQLCLCMYLLPQILDTSKWTEIRIALIESRRTIYKYIYKFYRNTVAHSLPRCKARSNISIAVDMLSQSLCSVTLNIFEFVYCLGRSLRIKSDYHRTINVEI